VDEGEVSRHRKFFAYFESAEFRQDRLDLIATRFQERRQLERSPKTFKRFVHRKSGRLGRDLEENVTWLAKVDRAKICPVFLVGRAYAVVLDQFAYHSALICVVGGPERNVVDRASALAAPWEIAN
jgi:hypothetical protein